MTKNIQSMLGVKDTRDLTATELRGYLDTGSDEEARHAHNNAICNETIEELFQRPEVGPADVVDIAIMITVKMTIGSAPNPSVAADMTAAVVERMLTLVEANLNQVGDEERSYRIDKRSSP